MSTNDDQQNIQHSLALDEQLKQLSHDVSAASLLHQYLTQNFKNSQSRLNFLTAPSVLIKSPITREQGIASGFLQPDEAEPFFVQGDIISSDAAYSLGQRVTGNSKFAIGNASCDLAGRRPQDQAVLFAVKPVLISNPSAKQIINELVCVKSNSRMFLPPFQNDDPDTYCNYIDFAAPATIEFGNLLLATRHASLSKLGWHIFNSLLRRWFTREAEFEAVMRTTN